MAAGPILIVDDDAPIRQLVADALALDGYPSVTAYNPATLAAALTQRPVLVFLDLMMPDLDPADVVAHVKAVGHRPAIPIVLMIARASYEPWPDIAYDDTLRKPFDLDTLLATVLTWIGPA